MVFLLHASNGVTRGLIGLDLPITPGDANGYSSTLAPRGLYASASSWKENKSQIDKLALNELALWFSWRIPCCLLQPIQPVVACARQLLTQEIIFTCLRSHCYVLSRITCFDGCS